MPRVHLGDKGETGLFGGRRVPKDNIRIEAYGSVDELNSFVGLAASFASSERVRSILEEIQSDLFVLGSDLAAPKEDAHVPRVTKAMIEILDRGLEEIEAELEKLHKFVLPGGAKQASLLHVARSVARRAERRVVALAGKEKINQSCIVYLNRLSSILFALARYENKMSGQREKEWDRPLSRSRDG